MSFVEWLRTLRLSSLERRQLWGDLGDLYGCLRKGHGEGGAELFPPVPSARMPGNVSKLH